MCVRASRARDRVHMDAAVCRAAMALHVRGHAMPSMSFTCAPRVTKEFKARDLLHMLCCVFCTCTPKCAAAQTHCTHADTQCTQCLAHAHPGAPGHLWREILWQTGTPRCAALLTLLRVVLSGSASVRRRRIRCRVLLRLFFVQIVFKPLPTKVALMYVRS